MPAPILVIDFETFFDDEYHMGRDAKALTTIEYVQDARFEVLGCGFLRIPGDVNGVDHEGQTTFKIGEEAVADHLGWLVDQFGDNLERCTCTAQNAVFDCTILARRYGIHPPHIIDILGLARHWHSRSNNDLAALCKRHGLKDKGETSDFKGLTLRTRFKRAKGRGPKMPILMPKATDEQLGKLSEYGLNDVIQEWILFTLLLPKLSNAPVEIALMNHTLNLALQPSLEVDYARAEEIKGKMQAELDEAVRKVMGFYGD